MRLTVAIRLAYDIFKFRVSKEYNLRSCIRIDITVAWVVKKRQMDIGKCVYNIIIYRMELLLFDKFISRLVFLYKL